MEGCKNDDRVIIAHNELSCLQELRGLLNENDSLNKFSEFLTDEFLLHFIRGRKHNVSKAYTYLVNYIDVRRIKYRFLFKPMLPSTTIALKQGIVRKLKLQDELQRNVFVARTWLWNPLVVSFDDFARALVMIFDEALKLEGMSEIGFALIIDAKGYSFQHAKSCTPAKMLMLVNILWKNMPLKYKAMHFVNEIFLVNFLYKTVRPFLPKKFQERTWFHSSNLDALNKRYLTEDMLPKSLGGNLEEDEAYDDDFDRRILAKEKYYERFAELL